MLQAITRLYRNAYGGLPAQMWWLAAVMLVNRSGTMVVPFLTVYLTGSGFTLGEAGLVMALFGCGAMLGGYLGGWLTDRIGFFHIQVLSLLFSGCFFIFLSYLHNLWQIGTCIFLLSICNEAFRPANASAIAVYSNEQNRTRCYSLNRLATNLGWAVGPAVGGLLASIDYSLLFWADGFTCMAASALLYISLRKYKVPAPVIAPQTAATVAAHKDYYFMRAMLFLLLVVVCFFQMFSILPVYYKTEVRLSEAVIGAVLAMNGLIIVAIEMVMIYHIENKYRSAWFMVFGSLLIGIAFLLLMISPLLSVVLISMVVITFGEMFLFPFSNKFWISRSNHHNRGQYAASYTITFALAHVIAPTFAAQLAGYWGFDGLFLVNFILCSSAALGFYFLSKQPQYGTI